MADEALTEEVLRQKFNEGYDKAAKAYRKRPNILVCGYTGSGKSSLIKAAKAYFRSGKTLSKEALREEFLKSKKEEAIAKPCHLGGLGQTALPKRTKRVGRVAPTRRIRRGFAIASEGKDRKWEPVDAD